MYITWKPFDMKNNACCCLIKLTSTVSAVRIKFYAAVTRQLSFKYNQFTSPAFKTVFHTKRVTIEDNASFYNALWVIDIWSDYRCELIAMGGRRVQFTHSRSPASAIRLNNVEIKLRTTSRTNFN